MSDLPTAHPTDLSVEMGSADRDAHLKGEGILGPQALQVVERKAKVDAVSLELNSQARWSACAQTSLLQAQQGHAGPFDQVWSTCLTLP